LNNSANPIHIGTCGWSFEKWRGAFYPRDVPHDGWLRYYAQYFDAVEINSTFYAPPSHHVIGRWLNETPEHFRFTCKAPREITHDRRLRSCAELMEQFLEGIAPLRSKLRCVLIQLPAAVTIDRDELALKTFVAELPGDFRFALEFRNASWNLPRIVHLLEDHHITWVWNDGSAWTDQNIPPFGFLPQTTDLLYVRLLGEHAGRTDGISPARIIEPRDTALKSWCIRISRHIEQASDIYLFSNNQYEGFAPGTCRRVAQEFGYEISWPEPVTPAEEEGIEQLELI
jgi:uncharacterized protein YecE (DUF72 family)